jgi:pilus assembly protein CpaC
MAKRRRILDLICFRGIAILSALALMAVPSSMARQAAGATPALQQAQAAQPAAVPAQANQQEGEASQTLHLLVGRSLVISSPTRIKRVSIADPTIAEAIVVSPTQVLVNGKAPGGVSLILWDEADQSQSFEVSVDIDILSLTEKIHEVFPTEMVQVETSKDVVVLSGRISSAATADKILEVVKNATPKVTSLMQVPPTPTGEILLEVKFAELDRNKASQLGINIIRNFGTNMPLSVSTQEFSPFGFANGGSSATSNGNEFTISSLLNIALFRPDLNLAATIQALQANNVLQILAEPNLLTESGKQASFLAGGEFPFPVLQGAVTGGGAAGITIQFREFGVRLSFTPTLTADGLIHLNVKPEVSSLDFTNALTISGFTIPALSTRRAESDMELRDGQSFAIAGLLDNRVTEQLDKIPGIGDIPILGKLFQSRSLTKSNDELLIVVTPRIVHPLDPGNVPPGPAFPVSFLAPVTPAKVTAPGAK